MRHRVPPLMAGVLQGALSAPSATQPPALPVPGGLHGVRGLHEVLWSSARQKTGMRRPRSPARAGPDSGGDGTARLGHLEPGRSRRGHHRSHQLALR